MAHDSETISAAPPQHAAAVVLAQPVVRGPVNAPVALHARHDEPVPELKAANPERLVKRCDVVVGCRCRGLVKLGHALPFHRTIALSIIAADCPAA